MFLNQLALLRKNIFWGIDWVNNFKIKNQFYDVKKILENSNSDFSKNRKSELLKNILDHAVSTVVFYQDYLNYKSIENFPIINKNIIRDNFDALKSSKIKDKNSFVVSTSGSTGTPFSVLQDKDKRSRNIADNLYFSKKSGYEIGDKLINIKLWPDKIVGKLFLKLWFKNIYPHSAFKMTDTDILTLIKNLKKDRSNKSLLGYPSGFHHLCNYLDKIDSEPINCNVTSIISFAEALDDDVRKSLYKYFGKMPLARYSNNENGIIAQEDHSLKLEINCASYYLEIFDMNKDEPLSYGNLGRIVITDLFNFAMPIIRYDTGDIGIIDLREDDTPYLKSLEGRKLDLIYNTKGEIVASHITYILAKCHDFKQYQFIQTGKRDYLIKLNTDKKVNLDMFFIKFKEHLGQDAKISVEYVDDIPLVASGKRREIMNIYNT